ncbi:MAG: sulfurtransferase TusA family protein [Candidatus Bathyarchaeota archaeon]|nr:sulfurtransferase TusA family protein [Candidatus Bathyarchaeota archaeon]MCZ2846289.1 sulfurtransferase TusA family protein [Candidatus Bathyarchaeota archaeon]
MKDDQSMIEVDSKFKSCPGPIIDLSEAVKNAKKGQIIRLIATDPASPSDVKEWTAQVGHKVLKISEEKGVYEIDIEVG